MHDVQQVVSGGYCVGCGVCSAATHGRIAMRQTDAGAWVAELSGAERADLDTADSVCPFSSRSADETAIAAESFAAVRSSDPVLGRFVSVDAGRVARGQDLRASSSGGITTWVLTRLLESGEVDAVLHVKRGGEPLFAYSVSRSVDELLRSGKSQYYAVTMAEVLQRAEAEGWRCAVVGVPCFIKGVRLLARSSASYRQCVRYTLALVCGHLKTPAFAELLAWQVGVPPRRLAAVDFRMKSEDRPASDYDFGALARGESAYRVRRTRSLLGGNWGHAMFQLRACDFCDDIFGETADVSLGDAWLPEFEKDWRGTNVVVARNPVVAALVASGRDDGSLELTPLSAERAARSQDGNVRHRRDGLRVRSSDALKRGEWFPKKRVPPDPGSVPLLRRRIVRQRERLAIHSHAVFGEAKRLDSLGHFEAGTAAQLRALQRTYKVIAWLTRLPLVGRVLRNLRVL